MISEFNNSLILIKKVIIGNQVFHSWLKFNSTRQKQSFYYFYFLNSKILKIMVV